MKIVINTVGSGINLRDDDMYAYCRSAGIELFRYYLVQESYRNQPQIWKKCDWDFEAPELTGKTTKDGPMWRYVVSSRDFGDVANDLPYRLEQPRRDCPVLIEMIESGKIVNGLKVVDVPDDIEWYIDDEIPYEYDTCREIIRQTHLIFE